MQTTITLQLPPSQAASNEAIITALAAHTGQPATAVTGYHLLRKSIDARSRQVRINLTLRAFINEPFQERTLLPFHFRDVSQAARSVVIIGAGPAGLFAALQLIEAGIKPVILERGKDVRSRRRDLALLNREGIVNEDSNYCFGEGGAGTYSDGKLYTRSNKRGNIDRILNLFVHFGADEKILYEAHPHIGTNKLPHIISAMREQVLACGGRFLFEKKLTRFIISGKKITGAVTADGDSFTADAFILATGHSARDIFEMLQQQQVRIEAKPFALGVRVEHPQELIDRIQYSIHQSSGSLCSRPDTLPPASYSLVQQVNQRGVFSFCMCPGGIIAPAATSAGELVVNGWSPSKRNNPFANSGMVVQVEEKDVFEVMKKARSLQSSAGSREPEVPGKDPLLFMRFQQWVEQQCYVAGGGNFVAPALRMTDFSFGKLSASLPACSYVRGLQSSPLQEVLPGFVYQSLAKGFQAFGKKMKGYFTNEAVVVATESRTSSPVRIPRDPETLAHPQLENLYPCGEGAGYAGGIVSAAMDGERIARQLAGLLLGATTHK